MKQYKSLSDNLVASLPAASHMKSREYTIYDRSVSVFGVRVRDTGHKSYILMIKREGRPIRMTIGAVQHMTCDVARQRALEHLATDCGAPAHPAITLGALVAGRWHDEHLMQCKPSTQRTYRNLLQNQLVPNFGNMQLDTITREAVADWFDRFSQTAPGNANRGLILLNQIMTFAVRHGLLDKNVVKGLRKNKSKKLTRFLSREELARLYRVMDEHVDECMSNERKTGRDIVRLLILTGCRKSEILCLRWDEIDGDRLRLQDSKTGPRDVHLSLSACIILDRHKRAVRRDAGGYGGYVFPSRFVPDAPVTTIDSFWYAVRKRAGLDDVRLHDLRHTFASHAVMNGVPLPVVARLLGHAKIAMTMRYTHVGDEAAEAAAELVGARVAELLDGGG